MTDYIPPPDREDMAVHMTTIADHASRASSILELGCAEGHGSTRALARGLALSPAEPWCAPGYSEKKSFISVDTDPRLPLERPNLPYWRVVHGSSISPETRSLAEEAALVLPFDLIFVDTIHVYEYLDAELNLWWPLCSPRAVWLFHDTWIFGVYNHMTEAIKNWCKTHPGWVFDDLSRESHGLGRMRREA